MAKKIKELKLCEFCGKGLTDKDSVWISSWGSPVCEDCVLIPLDILKQAYYAKTLAKAREIIKEFDDGCEESFLEEN